jgi:tetratricopeptide (TPR) repeat protein
VQGAALMRRGWDLLLAGRLDEVEDLVQRGRALSERCGYPDGFVVWGVLEFAGRRFAGDVAELSEFLQAIADTLRDRLGGVHQGLLAVSALIACETGRSEDARPALEQQVASDFADVPYDQSWLSQLNMWSAVAATLGHDDAAAALYQRLAPWHDHVVVMGNGGGVVSHYLGLLATTLSRHEDAQRHFADAMLLHDHLAVPFWAAQTRIALARLLMALSAKPDRPRALQLAREALHLASEHGFAALEHQASELVATLS